MLLTFAIAQLLLFIAKFHAGKINLTNRRTNYTNLHTWNAWNVRTIYRRQLNWMWMECVKQHNDNLNKNTLNEILTRVKKMRMTKNNRIRKCENGIYFLWLEKKRGENEKFNLNHLPKSTASLPPIVLTTNKAISAICMRCIDNLNAMCLVVGALRAVVIVTVACFRCVRKANTKTTFNQYINRWEERACGGWFLAVAILWILFNTPGVENKLRWVLNKVVDFKWNFN